MLPCYQGLLLLQPVNPLFKIEGDGRTKPFFLKRWSSCGLFSIPHWAELGHVGNLTAKEAGKSQFFKARLCFGRLRQSLSPTVASEYDGPLSTPFALGKEAPGSLTPVLSAGQVVLGQYH